MTSRAFVFTLNNYTEDEVQRIAAWVELPECLGISAGYETAPTTGTPHIQGWLCVRGKGGVRKSKFYKIVGRKFYLDRAGGSWVENVKYTNKDENLAFFKVPPESEQGRRNDLIEFRETLKRKPDISTAELAETHLNQLAKYPRLRNDLRASYLKKQTRKFRDVQVIVHWGDAGTGKTRKPYEEGAFLFDDYENGWWDGYEGESVICLDEFYGGIKFNSLLRWLDGYQLRLKIKGGFTYAQWSKVYITSNVPPDKWYPNIQDERKAALARRITKIFHFNKKL